jgi:AAA15 family ATPase/GTPase
VIVKLRESSPYFVLEECRIKRDECAFVGSKTSSLAVWQLTGFIIFRGKEYVRLKRSNEKQEEWVEKSEYIQEPPSSERKRQKPEDLTSNKIGELSFNPSERKENAA